jgi:hypothetical protein
MMKITYLVNAVRLDGGVDKLCDKLTLEVLQRIVGFSDPFRIETMYDIPPRRIF